MGEKMREGSRRSTGLLSVYYCPFSVFWTRFLLWRSCPWSAPRTTDAGCHSLLRTTTHSSLSFPLLLSYTLRPPSLLSLSLIAPLLALLLFAAALLFIAYTPSLFLSYSFPTFFLLHPPFFSFPSPIILLLPLFPPPSESSTYDNLIRWSDGPVHACAARARCN